MPTSKRRRLPSRSPSPHHKRAFMYRSPSPSADPPPDYSPLVESHHRLSHVKREPPSDSDEYPAQCVQDGKNDVDPTPCRPTRYGGNTTESRRARVDEVTDEEDVKRDETAAAEGADYATHCYAAWADYDVKRETDGDSGSVLSRSRSSGSVSLEDADASDRDSKSTNDSVSSAHNSLSSPHNYDSSEHDCFSSERNSFSSEHDVFSSEPYSSSAHNYSSSEPNYSSTNYSSEHALSASDCSDSNSDSNSNSSTDFDSDSDSSGQANNPSGIPDLSTLGADIRRMVRDALAAGGIGAGAGRRRRH